MKIADFSNSFAQLPERFFVRQAPALVVQPELVIFNETLARELGLDLTASDAAAIFAGNTLPAGADPIAMAYAGHQFGNFVPQLGDGRAILLGEVIDQTGTRRDIQLKGAGRTAFSRGGDGRAALGPVLREYLLSEAMHALGVPTTRALAAVTTGEMVFRDRALPGAVLTRIAASNIRVGTFQYFAARGDEDAIKMLADYVIERHYPALRDEANPYLALLAAVVDRQASLIAQWLNIGFIHGVMNTDNMTISGETIDFGPCAFMDAYDAGTVFSSIDQFGRYAYAQQPHIAQWNLTRLAETLLGLIDPDEKQSIARASEVLNGFAGKFEHYWLGGMRQKLGLLTTRDEDRALVLNLLKIMQENTVDFTLFFRQLSTADATPRGLFSNPEAFDQWAETWHERLGGEARDPAARAFAMRQVNPAFIPRNHLVEQALAAAVDQADFQPFHELLAVLQDPFEEQPAHARYAAAPPPSDTAYRTFCGT
jgi:uncharacterized protein YdiU (UPF0061 family)